MSSPSRPRARYGDPNFRACQQSRRTKLCDPPADCHRQAEMWCKLTDELYCRHHAWVHRHFEPSHESTWHRWL